MKNYLLKLKVCGIKNINKEIEVDFYKSVLDRNHKYENYNVKSLYGPNGAGKTAIIYALDLYRKIVLDQDFIPFANANKTFDDFINKSLKRFYIEVYFASLDSDDKIKRVFSHKLVLAQNNGRYELVEETLKELSGLRLNNEGKYKIIYKMAGGKVVNLINLNLLDKPFIDVTYNVSLNQSVPTLIANNQEIFDNFTDFYFTVYETVKFAASMTIVLQYVDTNYINLSSITSTLKLFEQKRSEIGNEIFYQLLESNQISNNRVYRIHKDNRELYLKQVKNMTNFIKVIKEDLIEIDVKEDADNDFIECEHTLVYKDGTRISEKLESAGIKKIFEIYFALCDVEKGRIVLIDEFDANIHDVLLVKIIEYISEYTKGQFIFTTHNLSPMDYLQSKNCSIDFLSTDSRITSWKKSGNYKAASLYQKGFIEYSPFNLNAFNFLGVFGSDEE